MVEYGVQIEPQFGFEYNDVLEIAQVAMNKGFSTLWFSDHFMLDADAVNRTLLDPWLLMTALIREKPMIRVGSLVFCNSYRHPSLVAKMAATLDHLSDGRLEFGIGAGWKKLEYQAYGYTFPPFSMRMKQLAEAIQIIRGAWTEDKFSFTGDHYTVKDLVSFPKPVQKPNPTIWVGSNMAGPRMVELAAIYGDGLNVAWRFGPERTSLIFKQLDMYAKKHDRSPDEILRSVGCWTRVLMSESEMADKIKQGAASRRISESDYRKRVESSLWGTPDMVADKLSKYKDQGISHIILMFPHGEEREQVTIFGDHVLPLL